MATYSKLLLSTGGGIISQIQQAEQVDHTATLLIGLGGTGIDCLTEVKKAVKERLQPDNLDALVPTYNHIRFLAVDTDLKSGISGFDQSETFDISNPNVKQALATKTAIKVRDELDWLDPDRIDGADIGDAGAGGFRQAGRYMMMDKSNTFLTKIKEMIGQAKKDAGKASLYVHIFAGISGGTGSGTFLDACYLIRKAIQEANGGDGVVLGYFFLPDVNLDRIPTTASLVHSYVPKNGYAAMQELDYCMRLPENGGSFTQTYKNGIKIEWNEPPVDLCHLISATDKSYQVVNNAYNNSMKVTAEYVMDFLTKPDDGSKPDANQVGVAVAETDGAESKFSIKSHLSNFSQMVSAADGLKTHGYHLRYLVIGASCASIPMRKINTYLTAKVFEAFMGLKDHTPTETEVAAIADRVKISNADALLLEITKNGGDSSLVPVSDAYGCEFTRDNGDKKLLYHYTDQKAEKLGTVEKNAKSMMDVKNQNSLLGRVCAALDECVADLDRGPAYAYKVVAASYAGNLINIIDGTIETVEKLRSQRSYNVYEQPGSYKERYEESRNYWYADKDKRKKIALKAFNNYVLDMEDYISGQIDVETYVQLLNVLKEVKKQIMAKADTYYLKFSRVMNNLMDTFHENLRSLNNDVEDDDTGVFAIPLIKISEIRPTLDATVDEMDMPGILKLFVSHMFAPGIDGKTCWEEEDDSKISRAVKNFFINTVFSTFANKSITDFLFDKYRTNDPQEVTTRLYNEYMMRLREKSDALFPTNSMIFGGNDNAIAYISVPSTAQVIINAAQQLNGQYPEYSVKKSALKDRIYIMRCSCALPMGAYANAELYGTNYYGDKQEGRHYYIGQGGSSLFNDWHGMLPLKPESLIEDANLPAREKALLDDARQAYADAVANKLLVGNDIMKISDAALTNVDMVYNMVVQEQAKADVNPSMAQAILQQALGRMQQAIDGITYEPSGYKVPSGNVSTPEIEERIRKDYFIISPALHAMVRNEMAKVAKYNDKLAELQEAFSAIADRDAVLKDFAKALFMGAVTWDKMFGVTYNKMEYGIPTPTPLTDFTQPDKFPYAQLALYQAFVTFRNIDKESRDAIVMDANQKFAMLIASPDAIANLKQCEAIITPAYAQGMMGVAATFPAVQQEASQFYGKLLQELTTTIAMIKPMIPTW